LWVFLLVTVRAMYEGTQNSRGVRPGRDTALAEEQDEELTDEEGSRPARPRRLYSTKGVFINKAIDAVDGTGSEQIYDADIGRPIWREARECMLSSMNEVGGGLADCGLFRKL
jgi:hypothetical protein